MTASASKKAALPNQAQIIKHRTERLSQTTSPSRSARRLSLFDCVPSAISENRIQRDALIFAADTHPSKLDLTAKGCCSALTGAPYRFNVVSEAEKRIHDRQLDKEYTLMGGLEQFNACSVELLLGKDHPAVKERRTVTVQSMSGTGALRLGAEYMRRRMQGCSVYLSSPSWNGHQGIFSDAGITWKTYRYLNKRTNDLDFEGMMNDLMAAPDKSVILLQGCAHSPTGIDPSRRQWTAIADVCLQKGHIPFFDVSFQGLASGCIDHDAYAPRLFVDKGLEIIAMQSYSKNLGLDRECIGALTFVVDCQDARHQVLIDMERVSAGLHAFPSVRGARLVAEIIHSADLTDTWKSEMAMITERVVDVRGQLHEGLLRQAPDSDWSFILKQFGIFAYLHLDTFQIEMLRKKHHVYLSLDGSAALSGLGLEQVWHLAYALANVKRREKR